MVSVTEDDCGNIPGRFQNIVTVIGSGLCQARDSLPAATVYFDCDFGLHG
jgi:hypothetical protein